MTTMGQYSTTYSPKVRVLIKDLTTGETRFDVSDDLASKGTNKAYGRCSGTWQMMLSYRIIKDNKRYHQLIFPNDMITIEMDRGDGSGYIPVMLGLVDRLSNHISLDSQGRPTRQVKVSGRDMGKLLDRHDIGWDIQKERMDLVAQETEAGPPDQRQMMAISRQYDPRYQNGTAAEFIKNLYELTFKNVVDSSKYYSLVTDTDDKWMRNMPLFGALQGRPLWSAMKEMEHAPYNTLHCDTESLDKFLILLERHPINSQGRLDRIPSKWHTVGDEEIITSDVGVADSERINFLFFNPTMYQTSLGLSTDVLIVHPEMTRHDEESIKLHGYHAKTLSSNFLPPSMTNTNSDSNPDALKSAADNTELYWSWYKNNHTYGSGAIQMHLRPDIKSGHGLLVDQADGTQQEYLIENVAHQCTMGTNPVFQTTLQLTRGQKHV